MREFVVLRGAGESPRGSSSYLEHVESKASGAGVGHLRVCIEWPTSQAICDAIVTGKTVLLHQPLFPKFCELWFDFVEEGLNEFGLGVWGGVTDLVVGEYP